MKRKPPKLTVEQIRRKWRRHLPRLVADVSDLLYRRQVYKELVGVLKHNEEVGKPPDFFLWIRDNYVTAMCVGIRRLTDCDPRSLSLGRMLCELRDNPSVISRSSHRALYPAGFRAMADSSFDKMAGKGETIGLRRIRGHIASVRRVEERIRRLVNKRIAHLAKPGAIRKLPTFVDIDEALETIDEILCHYNTLLKGEGLVSAYAVPQRDWRFVLIKAWLPGKPTSWPDRVMWGRHPRPTPSK